MTSWKLFVCSGLSLLLLAGCATEKPAIRKRKTALPAGVRQTDIAVVSLISVPVALNLDQTPGVDGFSLKLFASNWTNPKPVAFPPGTLKLTQYPGRLMPESQPSETWSFTHEEWQKFQFKSSIGIGYELIIPWAQGVPNTRNISIVAEFTPVTGEIIRSKPTLITVHESLPSH